MKFSNKREKSKSINTSRQMQRTRRSTVHQEMTLLKYPTRLQTEMTNSITYHTIDEQGIYIIKFSTFPIQIEK